ADLDVGVKEGEGAAGGHGFEPEGDLGQLGGHGVDVDAVDAVADDVVHRPLAVVKGGFGAVGPQTGDASGDAPGGGDEEVAGAAGGVAHGQGQQRGFGFVGVFGLVEEGVEG